MNPVPPQHDDAEDEWDGLVEGPPPDSILAEEEPVTKEDSSVFIIPRCCECVPFGLREVPRPPINPHRPRFGTSNVVICLAICQYCEIKRTNVHESLSVAHAATETRNVS